MTAKRKEKIWLGYLDAGKGSSPVVRDSSLGTGNPGTIYLYNRKKDRILEYRLDIVEPKLRDLTDEEQALAKDLKAGFKQAMVDFVPRSSLRSSRHERPAKTQPGREVPDLDDESFWPPTDDDAIQIPVAEASD